jgi:hypothetical protein
MGEGNLFPASPGPSHAALLDATDETDGVTLATLLDGSNQIF